MWRLLHKMFGWDYVSVPYGFGHYVRRVQRDGDSRPYVRVFGDMIRLDRPRYGETVPLTSSTEKLGLYRGTEA